MRREQNKGREESGERKKAFAHRPQNLTECPLDTFMLEQEIAKSDRPVRLITMETFWNVASSYFCSYKHVI